MVRFQAIRVVSTIVLLATGYALGTVTKAQTLEKSYVLQTSERAIERAIEYSGFDKLKGFVRLKSAIDITELIIARDSTTPFLSDSIEGKTAWRVEFKDIILREGARPITFDVLLDAETGRLFEIRSRYVGPPDERPCEPPAKIAREQLGMNIEKYNGFPTKLPVISFVKALDSLFGSPLSAKQTVALYVTNCLQQREPRPVWAISLHGLPPIPVKYGTIDFMRSVIDAQTGQRLLEVNLPYMSCDPTWYWPGVDTLKDNEK
jgi:hypothetical protein